MGNLTKHFSNWEFECSCGCEFDQVQIEFIERLQKVRENFGPLTINSGCRCERHNRKVGGSPDSSHLRGLAADIHCANSLSRFHLLRSLMHAGFQRIGIGQEFIHVDMDRAKPQSLLLLAGETTLQQFVMSEHVITLIEAVGLGTLRAGIASRL